MPNENKIYVINRNQYDNIESNLQEKSIYLVKENAASGNRLLSMYLGALRTTDVMDISAYVDYDPITKNYDIPAEFRIPNKLFFCKSPLNSDNPDYYRVFMWLGTSDNGKFVDCFGTPSNVNVVETLPQTGVTNDVYIVTTGNDKGLYVYNDSSYVEVLDLSNYPTMEWVREYVDEHGVDVEIDNNTILRNDSEELYSVGANVGTGIVDQYYCDDTGADAHTTKENSGVGAHIYNYYNHNIDSNAYNNAAVGDYSNAFGRTSRALGDYSLACGESTYVDYLADHGVAVGYGIINKSERAQIVGCFNDLSSSNTSQGSPEKLPRDYAFIIGNGYNSDYRSDALSVDWDGNVTLYGKRVTNVSGNTPTYTSPSPSVGNIKASTLATLATIRETVSDSPQSAYIDAQLPENSHEVLLSNSANSYARIASITVSDISKMKDQLTNRTDDYSCVYIFVKDSTVTNVSNLMTNFTSPNTSSETTVSSNPPKIYLLNPDLDISEYTVIHIFLFYDGIRMCAIAAGYEDTQFVSQSLNNNFGFGFGNGNGENDNNDTDDNEENQEQENESESDSEEEITNDNQEQNEQDENSEEANDDETDEESDGESEGE